MRRIYTTREYKKWHKRQLIKLARIASKQHLLLRRKKNYKKRLSNNRSYKISDDFVVAPSDLRLLDNLEGCLTFFRDLRSVNIDSVHRPKYIEMSLQNVISIDYGTISILTSLNDDLRLRGITLRTILPINVDCKKFMVESGYLNNLFDDKGRPFAKADKSDLIFFEKGNGFLSLEDSKKISLIVKSIVKHLTGEYKNCQSVRTIILEICGNSIEWSGTKNQQWLLGVKYEKERVIFTVTDVGRGILNTLYRKLSRKFFDLFKSEDEILLGAFDKKYGSATKEDNRNKGLPAIKSNFELGKIKNLKVLTNNVILHFDNKQLSMEFKKGTPRFRGTFYQWEMTRDCIII